MERSVINKEMSSNTNIIPKDCSYGCQTRIYWDTATNSYLEVFTKKKHICPNRVNKQQQITNTNNTSTAAIILIILLQQQQQQDPLIITKNPGPILNLNQRCPIPSSC